MFPDSAALNEQEMRTLMESLQEYFNLKETLVSREARYNLHGEDVEDIIYCIENRHRLQEAYVKCAGLIWDADTKINSRYEGDDEQFYRGEAEAKYEQAIPKK